MNNIDISVKNLCVEYDKGKKILDNVTFDIRKGLFYSVLGPNGCGKTTLLKALTAQIKAQSGEIFICNEPLSKLSNLSVSKKIAVVNQSNSILFDFSVEEIVLMGRTPYLKRFSGESGDDLMIAEQAMKKTKTYFLKNKSIKEISGGELQRVMTARALAQKTGIIMLDEPISNLDINHQLYIMSMLRDLTLYENITIFCVLHDLNIASRFSDEIIFLKEGKVISAGNPEKAITKENIYKIYGLEADIIINEKTGKPFIYNIELSRKDTLDS